ncbi:VCBS repeat-containing protein, partial [archaeon]|nr:VCBS repeat-containing protein [archaeon]
GSINNKGKIYVYSGAPPHNLLWSKKGFIAGNNLPPSLYNQYPEKYVEFGKGISSIPDTNGDGFEDILVEDPSYSPGGGILPGNHSHPPDSSGRVNLYSGIDGRLLWFGVGPNETHAYATDSSGIPDLNGDGFGDFVISGFGADNHRGKIYVYSGAPPHNLLWSKTGESVGDRFGYSVDGISDLDGDGFGDIVVNAANFNSIRGKVYVYSGNTGVLLWSYLGDTGVSSDGTVSGVHDLDGDGYSDIVVGEPYFSTLSNNWVGRIQVLSGNTGTLLWSENGLSYPENFGRFLSSVIGSNGRGKMIISSPQYIHNGMSLAGRVKVYSGDAAGGNLRWTYEGTHDGELFGRSVSGAPRY